MGRPPLRRRLDPDRHVIPTLGSKEAIFSFAQVVLDLAGGRDTVVLTEPGLPGRRPRRPVRGRPRRGAAAARGERLPPGPRCGSRRDVAAHGARLGQLPEQPDRRHGAARVLRAAGGARARARLRARLRRGVHASSGSTSRPSRRSSSPTGRTCAVFNTLSKRSSMTGYRSGFVAGDPELIAALKQFRPNVGTAPQEFVQRASVVAWGDEEHVERARAAYAAQARRCSSTCSRASGCATRAGRRRCTSGSRRRPARRRRPSRRACSSTV